MKDTLVEILEWLYNSGYGITESEEGKKFIVDQAYSAITKLFKELIGEDDSEHTGEDGTDYFNGGRNTLRAELRNAINAEEER
jgi:hypothetical protein